MSAITTEQILALAPDASSAKNGKTLATLRKWVSLGQNEQVVWGECQGSGKTPYQTQIDLTEIAFKCSCPSRKFPCKHGLGLLLLRSNEPAAAFTSDPPPEWVKKWLATRTQKRTKKSDSPTAQVDPATQAKRTQQRYNKVAAGGIQDLELWLRDLVRQGLAAVQAKPYSFWDGVAARMVDAQAPGVARQLRKLASIPHSGAGWQEKLLEKLGRLYLLLQGFKRLDTLPSATQADVKNLIGWTLTQDELLASDPADFVKAHWLILGQRVEEEDNLRVQRLWLWEQESNRAALILNFAHASQPSETSFVPGTIAEAELVFFESAYPLRAILKTRHGGSSPIEGIPGYSAIADMIKAYAKALSCNPWLEQFPVSLVAVIPIHHNGLWFVRDLAGHYLPLTPRFKRGWQLLALSGGHPLSLTLCCHCDERIIEEKRRKYFREYDRAAKRCKNSQIRR
jgi:hypothetical protein